jgi:aryl-alcohol dehydrogenase-like predicted oxidoreductase
MFERYKMELDYTSIFRNVGMGTTIFSPLAAGFLTGKYQGGIPEGSRLSLPGFEWLKRRWLQEDRIGKVQRLTDLAQRLDCSLAALAIAWCISNKDVTSAIVGATKKEQLLENFKALDVLPRLTPAVLQEIEGILENKPFWDSN